MNCNSYRGDDSGVYPYGDCLIPQPLIITKQCEDIESGLVKAELAFMDRGQWKRHTVERETIANKNKIISLANSELMITSNNANEIVAYLQALQPVINNQSEHDLISVSNTHLKRKDIVYFETMSAK